MAMNGFSAYLKSAYLPYIVPFALYALCTYLGDFFGITPGIVYPVKTIVVAASLLIYWNAYKQEIKVTWDWLAVVSGVIVFLVWILPEGLYPQIGHSEFNPHKYAEGNVFYFIVVFRMLGATLVVPLMEELFWRSFALRYLINTNFKSVPLGQFSWLSFVVVSLAFGFEHHRWLVGIVAGLVYAGVLYRRKNLFVPILSHAVTNFLLGLYVLTTQKWSFW
jgi:CAAX prenyl protease-like protein